MLRVVDVGVAAMTKHEVAVHRHEQFDPSSPNDQDAWLANHLANVYAVADGVASSPGAQHAAQAVCRMFDHRLTRDDQPTNNDEVLAIIREKRLADHLHSAALLAGALTTFTGVMITPDAIATYLHIGDSRLLLRRDNEVHARTTEQMREEPHLRHFVYGHLGRTGSSTDLERVPLTPEPNMPSRYMVREAEWGSLVLRAHDRLILVTDGITGDKHGDRLSRTDFEHYTDLTKSASEAAQALVDNARKVDDRTALVIDIDERD
jgi:serine/threonine protein phosphatase PrpC